MDRHTRKYDIWFLNNKVKDNRKSFSLVLIVRVSTPWQSVQDWTQICLTYNNSLNKNLYLLEVKCLSIMYVPNVHQIRNGMYLPNQINKKVFDKLGFMYLGNLKAW